jgi:hypothetical protein
MKEILLFGAAGGTRTHNRLLETDFKSVVYTIPPPRHAMNTRFNLPENALSANLIEHLP